MQSFFLSLLFSTLVFITITTGQERGALRLLRNGATSQSYNSGRLQVYYVSSWGSICGDTSVSPFGAEAANVACRQLGYIGASSHSIASTDSFGNDGTSQVIDDVSCSSSGNYLVLLRCSFSTSIDTGCGITDDVGVTCYTTRIWFNPFPGMVRLQGGTYSNQGRLEVYCNGQWGTVCGDGFTSTDGGAMCRQLGYTSSSSVSSLSHQSNTLYWASSLNCQSNQRCYGDCSTCPSSALSPNCTNDAVINCQYTSSTNTGTLRTCDTRTYPRDDGAVRLVHNGTVTNSTAGRVQVYFNGQWTNICYRQTFTMAAANVICHQLGYTGAIGWSWAAMDQFGVDGHATGFDDVQCSSGDLLVFQQCSYSVNIHSLCTDNDDISVNCTTTRLQDNPYPGMVRLVGSEFVNEGRVEVYCNGVWGTVCNTGFGSSDMYTICKQLGYNAYWSSGLPSLPGNVSSPIWFTNLPCSSSYSCIGQCSRCPSVATLQCSHDQDATVQCYYSGTSAKTTQSIDNCQITDLGAPTTGSIILSRSGIVSSSYNSGRVVLRLATGWGNICRYSSFGRNEAEAVCHQLTYSGASSWSYAGIDNFGVDDRPAVIHSVSCTGYELVLLGCTYSTVSSSVCTDSADVSVTCYTTRIWDNPFSGSIRLVNGDFTNEGRLEVYCNGAWGTVCNSGFSGSDAIVMCKQLGYNTYSSYSYKTDAGNASQDIWFTSLPCSSSYTCISQCASCPLGRVTSCTHSRDVYLRCSYSTTSSTAPGRIHSCKVPEGVTGTPQSGAIVLTRNNIYSSFFSSGRVVMYGIGSSTSTNRFWGNICRYRSFGQTEADVICHQLTYSGASSWSYAGIDTFGNDSRPALLDDVSCPHNNYLMIFQCTVSTAISSACTDSDDVSVTCYTTRIWNNPFNGQIRLFNGSFVNSGLLEVYCNGRWGTVCDDSYGLYDARASCRQLGYSSFFDYDHLSLRGTTSQPIWFDSLTCSSGDNCITDCERCPTSEDHNCGHSEDITLTCYSPTATGSPNFIRTCAYTNVGAIVGGTIGGIAGVIIVIIVIVVFVRHQHKKGNINLPSRPPNPFRNIHFNFNIRAPARRHTNRNTTELRSVTRLPDTQQQEPPPQSTATTGRHDTFANSSAPPQHQAPPPAYNPDLYPAPAGPLGVAFPPPPSDSGAPYLPYPTSDSNGGEEKGVSEGFRKEEPPAYDPSWAYPPPGGPY